MTLARRQAEFAAGLRFDDLSEDVLSSVKERVLDTLGVALAASALESSESVRTVAAGWGPGNASAIGVP
ncbi:MAG TPA: MmgE/PrpD family protein, partial [Candidatus Limnocylindrales bacterium]|nr:MmgE/PrpD family protein [Candidatus Limnocylindrales bacterium]